MAVKTKTTTKKNTGLTPLAFADKLVLNQWIMSLLGIDPFIEHKDGQRLVRPIPPSWRAAPAPRPGAAWR